MLLFSGEISPPAKLLGADISLKLYILFFKVRGNSKQSFHQKWDPCRAFLVTDFWRGMKQLLKVRKSLNANIWQPRDRKKLSLPKASEF